MTATPKRERAGAAATAPTLGKQTEHKIYSGPSLAATVAAARRRAGLRVAEITRLVRWRLDAGECIDVAPVAVALAHALALAPAGRHYSAKLRRFLDSGLDAATLADALARCGVAADRPLIIDSIDAVEGHQQRGLHLLGADGLGKLLRVTRIERDAVKLTGIEAIDEDRAARALRRKAEKRQRDAARLREKRNTQPRSEYLAAAAAKRTAREAEGVSRTTEWRRRRLVKQVCRSAYTYTRGGDVLVSPVEKALARSGAKSPRAPIWPALAAWVHHVAANVDRFAIVSRAGLPTALVAKLDMLDRASRVASLIRRAA